MPKKIEINHSDPIGKTLMLMVQTSRLIIKYVDACFYQKTPISFTKFMVLKVLVSNNGILTPTQLAAWTQTEIHNITTLLARMKKEDLVYTKQSDKDRRKVNVFITDKGRRLLKQAMPVAAHFIDQIMRSITEENATHCSEILKVLRDNAFNGLEGLAKHS